jgi:hypothetical protein
MGLRKPLWSVLLFCLLSGVHALLSPSVLASEVVRVQLVDT